MGDYIERQSVVYAVRDHFCDSARTLEAIDAIPAADVRPVVRGRWIRLSGCDMCDQCGYSTGKHEQGRNFCPNCGADMRGEQA